jgi:hypothetical protein
MKRENVFQIKKITILYNVIKRDYSRYIVENIKFIADKNKHSIYEFPENNDFNKYQIVYDILENEYNKTNKAIIITNCIDILLEFSNVLKLSFTKSENVQAYLTVNKINKDILITPDKVAVYEIDNKNNRLREIEVGYFGIKSEKLKNYIDKSSKRYESIDEIFRSYCILNKEIYLFDKYRE